MSVMVEADTGRLQRLSALEKANWVRSRRVRLKDDLKAGRVSFSVVLADPPDWLLTAKVYELLLAVPAIGRTTADAAFRACHMSLNRRFGEIADRQQRELLFRLSRTPVVAARLLSGAGEA